MTWTASIKLDIANAIFSGTPIHFDRVFVGETAVAFKSTGPDPFCLENRSLTKLVQSVINQLWSSWASSEL